MAEKQEVLTIGEAMEGLPPDFQFFAERFRTSVQPGLVAREADREAAVKKQRNFIIIGIALALAIAGGSFFLGEDGVIFGLFIGVAVALGMGAWGSMALNKLGKETKLMLVEPVTSAVFPLIPNQLGATFSLCIQPFGQFSVSSSVLGCWVRRCARR